MNDADRFYEELERLHRQEQEKHEEAMAEKAIADDMKEAALKKEKAARAAMRELDAARLHFGKAYALNHESDEEPEVAEENADTETVIVKEEKKKNGNFITGLGITSLAAALLVTGFVLNRTSKTGDVRMATSTIGVSDTVKDEPEDTTRDVNYSYNYDSNVVTVSDPEYVELTTEAFERLTTETITTLRGYGLTVSDEDIVKYVMIRNIDKLRQDNNGLISEIVGDQDPVEVFADADNVIDAIMTYNLLYFDANHNTDGFISSSVGVFDETQKARVLEIEGRVFEIGANYQDEEKYNELTYSLLRDMIDPSKEISELEDGVSYGVMWINMYMVRSTFGTNRYIKLNDTNADMIKYYVSFAGDGEDYEMNALVNGNVRNINALLEECTKGKTLTR